MLICIQRMGRQQHHQSLYAYSDWHGPHMHMGINDIQILVCIWGSCQSPYANGDSPVTNPFALGHCMHMGIWSPDHHMQTFAYGDPHLHTGIYHQKSPIICIWGSLFANGCCMHMVINIHAPIVVQPLTHMGSHECQLFNKHICRLITSQMFILFQCLIARKIAELFSSV
jgi:hypothetical protein